MNKIIKIAAFLLSALCLVGAFTSCGAPDLNEVGGRFVELIEASDDINDIFFGEGLDTYERGGDFATEHHIYDDLAVAYDAYEIVETDTRFYDISSIKAAAEAVYSADYLRGVYTMAFDGVADPDTGYVTTARYLETDGFLLRYAYGEKDSFDLLEGKEREYLYDTMKITRGNAGSVLVSIDSYLEDEENTILTVNLRFILQNGDWVLDTPTY